MARLFQKKTPREGGEGRKYGEIAREVNEKACNWPLK
jgi:hypothetical protein